VNNFKDLIVWQKSIELTKEIYLITKNFPQDEKYGLISQMKRAAVSIPSNIAEGAGRKSSKEFKHFLAISTVSIFELETQIIIASHLNLIDELILNDICLKVSEIQKMLFGLEKSINISN